MVVTFCKCIISCDLTRIEQISCCCPNGKLSVIFRKAEQIFGVMGEFSVIFV